MTGSDASTDVGLPLVQFVDRPGVIDLGWGHPAPELLPVHGLKAASARVFDRHGVDALNYGYAAGPGPLIAWLSDWTGSIDGRAARRDEIVITAGTSHAIDQVTGVLTRPGDVVLVDVPTYHLAIKILREHPVELIAVASDGDGVVIEDVRRRARALRAEGRHVALMYTVPTFSNPTGVSMSVERRAELVEVAADAGFVIIEDDAYRELSYDAPPPPSLWSMAPQGTVIRLGSFAKSLAPGLRCGYITADPNTVARIRDSGVLDSGGGISHFSALVIAEFASTGEYAGHVEKLRASYRERRDALLESLSERVSGKASWMRPGGGYFVWLKLLDGMASELLADAEVNGVSFLPGGVFDVSPSTADAHLRLSFTRYAIEDLQQAADRLGTTLERCSGYRT